MSFLDDDFEKRVRERAILEGEAEEKVRCPSCGSEPGEVCMTPSSWTTRTHSARVKKFERMKAKGKV